MFRVIFSISCKEVLISMKIAKVIAGIISCVGFMITFGSIGNLDYTATCGQALSAADAFTEFTKAWIGLLIFAAGAAFIGFTEYCEMQRKSADISERSNEV